MLTEDQCPSLLPPEICCFCLSQPYTAGLSFMLVLVMVYLLCDQDAVDEAGRKRQVNSFPPLYRDVLAKLDHSGWQEWDHWKGSTSEVLGPFSSQRELDLLLVSSLITPKGLIFFLLALWASNCVLCFPGFSAVRLLWLPLISGCLQHTLVTINLGPVVSTALLVYKANRYQCP